MNEDKNTNYNHQKAEIIAIKSKRMKRVADRFVHIYDNDSPIAAAKWLRKELSEVEMGDAREYIHMAFLAAGWTFDEVEKELEEASESK